MGVTSLWEILDPVGEKGLNLSELSGKTLAVDLSAWIVQMKTAGPTGLHNIYIRYGSRYIVRCKYWNT